MTEQELLVALKKRCKFLKKAVAANTQKINRFKNKSAYARSQGGCGIDMLRKDYYSDKLHECQHMIALIKGEIAESYFVDRSEA